MFDLHIDAPGASPRLAILTIDDRGRAVNTLSPAAIDEVARVLETVDREPDVVAVILVSGKPDDFIAGADVETFARAREAAEIEAFSRRGHAVLSRIAGSTRPVVAAIHGTCLGAGAEVALACHARVCTDAPSTVFGFPEVRLGLFPGGGGLGRLPRLVGLRESLDLVLTGRRIRPRKALEIGLVDEVVPRESLLAAARDRAARLVRGQVDAEPRKPAKDELARVAVEGNPVGRAILFRGARKQVHEKTRGLYPAPLVAIDILERGAGLPLGDALALEPPAFAELARGEVSRSLLSLFLRAKALERREVRGTDGVPVHAAEVTRLGIVGAGFMGADIAVLAADRGLEARIADAYEAPLGRALARIDTHFARRSKSVGATNVFKARARTSAGIGLRGFGTMDVVVEAVPEDLALKQRVFAELDELCPTGCVLASNTSALPIARIAERCVHKDRVIGLHFFSPVHEMPLLEIVRAPATSQRAVATAIALARRLGKTPIVVADAPGFYTTRVLGFYLMAALRLAEHGHAIADIDAGARDVGWPVGPFALLDEVGIDVGAKVLHTLASAFPARVEIPDAVDRFLAEERFGRKSGRGFYVYPKDKKKRIDPEVMRFFAGRPTKGRAATPESLGERLTFVFAMEAVRCLEEGVVSGPSDGDVGAVLGLGYPPLRGGPFRHVDSLGIANVVARLDELGEVHGPGYEVPDSLRELARTGRRFADVPASAEGA